MNNVYSATDDLQLGLTPQIDKLACKAEFTLVLPEKIKKYTVK